MIGRETIARRYRYLWTGEAAAIGAFLLLFFIVTPPRGHWSSWIARTYALAILLGILLQGVFWWRARLRRLRTRNDVAAAGSLLRFGALRWINWLMIAGFPLVLLFKAAKSPIPIPDRDTWWGIAFIAAAILEQINYYYFQLTYGYGMDLWYLRRHRRLRRGNIGRYLDDRRGLVATNTRRKKGD